jgi:hypothetical protein
MDQPMVAVGDGRGGCDERGNPVDNPRGSHAVVTNLVDKWLDLATRRRLS